MDHQFLATCMYNGLLLKAVFAPISYGLTYPRPAGAKGLPKLSSPALLITLLVAAWFFMYIDMNTRLIMRAAVKFVRPSMMIDIIAAASMLLLAEWFSFAILRWELRRMQRVVEECALDMDPYGSSRRGSLSKELMESKEWVPSEEDQEEPTVPGLTQTSSARTRLAVASVFSIAAWIATIVLLEHQVLPTVVQSWQHHLLRNVLNYAALFGILTVSLEAWNETLVGTHLTSTWATELAHSHVDQRNGVWELWLFKMRCSQMSGMSWQPTLDELHDIEKEPLLRQAYIEANGDLFGEMDIDLAYGE